MESLGTKGDSSSPQIKEFLFESRDPEIFEKKSVSIKTTALDQNLAKFEMSSLKNKLHDSFLSGSELKAGLFGKGKDFRQIGLSYEEESKSSIGKQLKKTHYDENEEHGNSGVFERGRLNSKQVITLETKEPRMEFYDGKDLSLTVKKNEITEESNNEIEILTDKEEELSHLPFESSENDMNEQPVKSIEDDLEELFKTEVSHGTVIKRERFNKLNLDRLLELSTSPLRNEDKEAFSQLSQNLRHYIDSSDTHAAFCEVEYRFAGKNKRFGRLYGYTKSKYKKTPPRNVCLQTFPRWVRSFLASQFYWDLDIVNCHPTLILGWSKMCPILSDHRVDNLAVYVDSREEVINLLISAFSIDEAGRSMLSRKHIKKLVNTIMFGGSLSAWIMSLKKSGIELHPSIDIIKVWNSNMPISSNLQEDAPNQSNKFKLAAFQQEIWAIARSLYKFATTERVEQQDPLRKLYHFLKEISDSLNEESKEISSKKKKNREFQFLSILLQETERSVLSEIENSLMVIAEKHKFADINPLDTLIHDGGLVRRRQATISDWKRTISFNVLPFNTYFDQTNLENGSFEQLPQNPFYEQLNQSATVLTRKWSKILGEIQIRCVLKELDDGRDEYTKRALQKIRVPKGILRSYWETKYYIEEEHNLAYIMRGGYYTYKGELVNEEMLKKHLSDLFYFSSVTESSKKKPNLRPNYADEGSEDKDTNLTSDSGASNLTKHRLFITDYLKDHSRKKFSNLKFIEGAAEVPQIKEPTNATGNPNSCEPVKYLLTMNGSYPLLHKRHENTDIGSLHAINNLFCILTQLSAPDSGKSQKFAYDMDEEKNLRSKNQEKFTCLSFEPQFDLDSDLFCMMRENFNRIRDTFPNLTAIEPELSNPLFNHLFILVGRNQEIFEYVIKYFAFLANYPDKKFGGCGLIFTGEDEGSGKSLIVKLFMDLFAPFAKETNESDFAFGKFSAVMEFCLLLHFEDLKTNDLSHHGDSFKSKITSDSVKIERKNVQAYQTENYCRFIISSNKKNPLNLTYLDRRWAVIPCSNDLVGDSDYFRELDLYRQKVCHQQAALLTILSISIDVEWNPETSRPLILCQGNNLKVHDTETFLEEEEFQNNRDAQDENKGAVTKESQTFKMILPCKHLKPEINDVLLQFLSSLSRSISKELKWFQKYFIFCTRYMWVGSSSLLRAIGAWVQEQLKVDTFKSVTGQDLAQLFKIMNANYVSSAKGHARRKHLPIDYQYFSQLTVSEGTPFSASFCEKYIRMMATSVVSLKIKLVKDRPIEFSD